MARAPPPARYAELVAAIRAADAALAAADPRAVVARLTTARVWRWQELQSLARLAEAWLQLSPANPDETAARLVALGGFLRAVALVRAGRGRELPLLAEAWNAARISDIEARARAALSLPDPPPYLDQMEP